MNSMLIGLEIKNFAIVSNLSTEWHNGMTAITGETGAGKSIAIDALGLCLGERAEAANVRKGAKKAEITACFNLKGNAKCTEWLGEHDLDEGEDNSLIPYVSSGENALE